MSDDIPEAPFQPPVKTVRFIVVFGVLLPILALIIELCFRPFEDSFFDPMPTPFHGLLIALVPLSNAILAASLILQRPLFPRFFPWLQAFALGISFLYAVLFLPAAPIASIAILFFGLGLLPLSPLLSFIAALLGRHHFERMTGTPLPYVWRGMALAVAAIVVLDVPATITRIGLEMAVSDTPATQLSGVRWLRAVGNESRLVRHCRAQSGMASGLAGSLLDLRTHIHPDQARLILYRVTGKPFDSYPVQESYNGYQWRNGFDFYRGGDVVGKRVTGVSLASSSMDGSIDAKAALGYLEWTMVFKNSNFGPEEGRAELLLPPGAVVSRATLWINGEEREAAFGSRGQVREAYVKVVSQRRDPLLVTTAGRDRVLVQLFPIPGNGEMKIRIGITAPMTMRDLQRARLQLPSFSERNFEIAPSLRHAVWVESSSALEGGAGLRAEKVKGTLFAVRGELPEPAAGLGAAGIEAARPQMVQAVWGPDDKAGDDNVIVQTLSEKPLPQPGRVAIVIDGSHALADAQKQLAEVLAAIPGGLEVAFVFAGDEQPVVVPYERATARRFVEKLDFAGGQDSTEALATAWDWASATPAGAIVWIHAVQPDMQSSTDALLQRFERRPGQVTLYDVEATPGPNTIARKLDGHALIKRVAREGTLAQDLSYLFGQWAPGALQVVTVRERQAGGDVERAGKTSSHLARLWAAERIAAASLDPKQHDAAVAMAVRYQLVTPLSGAIVLETQQQYDEAGLQPVAPGSVPTIPEPETWLLIIVALSVLGLRYRKRSK
jgi:hypothetical protein